MSYTTTTAFSLVAQQERIAELEAENERLTAELEAPPDYRRVQRARALADAEYVGQAYGPLWEWAWSNSLQEVDSHE